jgi:hypothetical protein
VLVGLAVGRHLGRRDTDDGAAGQVAREVDEVARLAQDAPAAGGRVVHPVPGRNVAGIDRDQDGLRAGGQQRAHLLDVRREAAVEADHDEGPRRPAPGRLDRAEFRRVQGQRLLDEHRLAGIERVGGKARVAAVARRDHDQVGLGIGQHGRGVGGGGGEAVFAPDMAAADAVGGGDLAEGRAGLGEGGYQGAPGEFAGADAADPRRAGQRGARGRRQRDLDRRLRRRCRVIGRVFQQDAEALLIQQRGIGGRRLGQRETVGDERRIVERAGGREVEDRLEIALLRPPNVSKRIIPALIFVERIVSSRPVRAGDLEGQLLLVEIGARQLQPDDTDQHDPPTLAAHLRGVVHRAVAAGRGADQYAVDATSAREGPRRLQRAAARQVVGRRAELLGEREPRRVEVEAEHGAAIGAQDLHGDQADQAEAHHHHTFAQGRLQQPHALQRDRAQHGEGRRVVAHPVGHARAQVLGRDHDLRVRAVRYHPVADLETRDAGADLDHLADVAVAERQRLVELGGHRLVGWDEAVGTHLVHDLAHLVRLLARLVDQVGAAEFDQHALGPGGDQRSPRADAQMAGAHARGRHLDQLGLAVLEVLEHLEHGYSGSMAMGASETAGAHAGNTNGLEGSAPRHGRRGGGLSPTSPPKSPRTQ